MLDFIGPGEHKARVLSAIANFWNQLIADPVRKRITSQVAECGDEVTDMNPALLDCDLG